MRSPAEPAHAAGHMGVPPRSVALLLALATLIASSATVPSDLAAQTDPSGEWDVRWAQAVRVHGDGEIEIQAWGEAVLVLDVEGDVVTGRWTTNVMETVNWTLEGTWRDEVLTLAAFEHDSDNEELDVVERLDFEIRTVDDGLEGWVELTFRGMNRAPGRRPLTAVHH